MFCSKCGTPLPENATFCPQCGAPLAPSTETYNPQEAGAAAQASCPPAPESPFAATSAAPDAPQAAPVAAPVVKSRTVAGVLGILLGGLGIHKFYLGYSTAGVIELALSIGLAIIGLPGVIAVIGLIEGIIYLTKSDQDFYDTYVAHKKEWF